MPTRLGDLPLAVEQAGSLLADTGISVDEYLRLLTERAHDVLDHDPGGAYPQSVTASWVVAFDRLALDDPSALDLLTLVAWCSSEPVPLRLLTEHPDTLPEKLQPIATDPLVLARTTGILHRRGMVTVSPHGIQLHRIPAALLRARCREDRTGRRRLTGSRASSPCSTGLPPAMSEPIRVGGHCGDSCCRTSWLRPATMPRWTQYRPTRPGCSIAPRPTCWRAANPRPPWHRYERAYDVRRTRFGADHPDTLTSASNLALNLWYAG